MNKIKSIIFDMGGVLVDLDVPACMAAFRDGLKFTRINEILSAGFVNGIYGALESGRITADEFRAEVLQASAPGYGAADVDAAFGKILKGIAPEKVELLHRLSKDYDLYMLSNNNAICLARAREMFVAAGAPLEQTFKRLFMSFEMKMLKPDVEIYRETVNAIGGDPQEMLFIDDVEANVDGARTAGLHAVRYEPGTDLAATVEAALAEVEEVRCNG